MGKFRQFLDTKELSALDMIAVVLSFNVSFSFFFFFFFSFFLRIIDDTSVIVNHLCRLSEKVRKAITGEEKEKEIEESR